MSSLVRLYPRAWRARYGVEFEGLLAERPPSTRDVIDIVLGALDARLSPQVETAKPPRRIHVTDRMAGVAAISGGLLWCGTYLAAGITKADADYSIPILTALGLMLLSLPGTYLAGYLRPLFLGAAASGLSLVALFGGLLPWGPMLLVPGVIILAALGPGALALAATRAGIAARARWRLLLLTIPWPVIGGVVASAGLLPEPIFAPLVVGSMLPLGLAWIGTGARISRGTIIDTGDEPPSTIATAGGIA